MPLRRLIAKSRNAGAKARSRKDPIRPRPSSPMPDFPFARTDGGRSLSRPVGSLRPAHARRPELPFRAHNLFTCQRTNRDLPVPNPFALARVWCSRPCLVGAWWRRTGSNRRPPACKAGALPTELRPHRTRAAGCWRQLVGPGRFELPTSRLSSARSHQLSYEPGAGSAHAWTHGAAPADWVGKGCVGGAGIARVLTWHPFVDHRSPRTPIVADRRAGFCLRYPERR